MSHHRIRSFNPDGEIQDPRQGYQLTFLEKDVTRRICRPRLNEMTINTILE